MDNEFFEELARKNLALNKYHEAALIIYKFKFHEKFELNFILDKLVDSNRIPIAKQLCEDNEELKLYLIK